MAPLGQVCGAQLQLNPCSACGMVKPTIPRHVLFTVWVWHALTGWMAGWTLNTVYEVCDWPLVADAILQKGNTWRQIQPRPIRLMLHVHAVYKQLHMPTPDQNFVESPAVHPGRLLPAARSLQPTPHAPDLTATVIVSGVGSIGRPLAA